MTGMDSQSVKEFFENKSGGWLSASYTGDGYAYPTAEYRTHRAIAILKERFPYNDSKLIDLGCGAGQLKITVVGIIFALLIILVYSVFLKRIKIKNTDSVNLAIIINQNISDSNITKIIEDIKKISNELNFVSMSRTNKNTNINLDIYPKKFEDLIKITDSIKNHYKNSKIIIARGNDLSL